MKKRRYLIIIGLLGIIAIFILLYFAFPKRPISLAEKFKTREERLAFIETLSLKDVVILGGQVADKYDMRNAVGVVMEGLGPRWQKDPSTIPETISIVLNTKLNPEWKKFLIDSFKQTELPLFFEENDIMAPFFLKYLEDKSKDQKTKVVLLEILGCWFEGYEISFIYPERESLQTKENFELANRQANLTIASITKLLQDRTTDRDVSEAAKALLKKVHQIYLDEDDALPKGFKSLESFNQVKARTESLMKEMDIPPGQAIFELERPGIKVVKEMHKARTIEEKIDIAKRYLSSDKEDEKERAISELGSLGGQAVPVLLEQLKIELSRKESLELGKAKEPQRDVSDPLRETISALGHTRDRRIIEPLGKIVESDKVPSTFKESAVETLGIIGSVEGSFPIIFYQPAKPTEGYEIREADRKKIEEILIVALKDKNFLVRMGAIEALGRIGATDAIPILKSIAESDPYVDKFEEKGEVIYVGYPVRDNAKLVAEQLEAMKAKEE